MNKNATFSRVARPNWQRKLISQAIAMAGAGMQASAALAACPGTVNSALTTTCTLNAGNAATITSTGSIIVPTANSNAISIAGDNTTIDNSGTLQGTEAGVDQTVGNLTVNIQNRAGATIAGVRNNSGSAAGISLVSLHAGSTLTNAGTVTGSATGSDFASAAGIYISSGVNAAITNSGTLNATANASSSASAAGIYVNFGGMSATGSITNSGTINATANATESAYAAGIDVYGDVAAGASITNSGTINVVATSTNTSTGSAHADGIVNSGTLSGTLTNSGTINVTANAAQSAEAHGLVTSGVATGGTVTNSGHITATAQGITGGFSSTNAVAASAVGILIDGAMGGTITNSGTITVTATGAGAAQAGGIFVTGTEIGISGPISNSGTIDVSATAGTAARAAGLGATNLDSSSTLTNSGSISVDVTTTGSSGGGFYPNAYDAGIVIGGLYDGSITNSSSGQITVTATAAKYYASAAGIYANFADVDSAVSNAGTITASATAQSTGLSAYAFAGGIRINQLQGDVTNSGTIHATADGAEGAVAIGIDAFTVGSGATILNSGTITATAIADSLASTNIAAGIWVANLPNGASLTNSGTITVTGSQALVGGESTVGAAGIYAEFLNVGATVTNTGTITANTNAANGAGAGWAIYIGQGNTSEGGFPMVVNSGTLNGNVYLDHTSLNNSGTLSIPVVGATVGAGYATQGSTVGGNYTQLAGGVLEVGVHSAAEYGKLQVNGTADFSASGHIAVNVTPVDALVNGDRIDNVVHAGTLVDGGGADLFTTDNSALWDFTAIDDGENGIDLAVRQGLSLPASVIQNGPKWALPAATAMQAVIDGGEASGDMANVVAALGALGTSQELSQASAQFVPVIAGQSSQQANLAMDELSSIVMGRLDAVRATGLEGSHDKNLWVRPFATHGKQNSDNGYPGYNFHSAGVVIGYDGNVGSNFNLGGALAYSEPQVDSDTPWFDHDISIQAYQASVYGYWDAGNHSFVDTLLIGGYNDNSESRRITFGGINERATGNYDGYYGRASIAAGHAFQMTEHAQFVPSLNVAYTYISEDSYKETGAGALDLKVDSNDASSLIFGADAAFTYTAETTIMTIHAGGGYDTLTDQVDLGATFVGGGPKFTTKGQEPEKWLVRAGVGFQVAPTSQLDLNFTYDYEYRDTWSNNLLTATARFKL